MDYPQDPLLKLSDGLALAWPVLGVYVQLEPAVAEDEDRYAAAVSMVKDWIGAELRWTHTTTFATPQPFRPTDFDFVVDHARASDLPPVDPRDELSVMLRRHHVMTRLDFSMESYGGAEDNGGSPFSFAFHAEVPDPETSLKASLPTCLRVTVPTSTDLGEFYARVTSLLSVLRIRWASAGLTYSGATIQWYDEVHEAIYQHARRHPGFDVPVFIEQGNAFANRVRSINWLTWIGPELARRVPSASGSNLLRIDTVPGAVLVQAGDRPVAGDTNRFGLPPAYRAADALVRAVRAREDIHFLFPWTEKTTTDWLRRFERRLPFDTFS